MLDHEGNRSNGFRRQAWAQFFPRVGPANGSPSSVHLHFLLFLPQAVPVPISAGEESPARGSPSSQSRSLRASSTLLMIWFVDVLNLTNSASSLWWAMCECSGAARRHLPPRATQKLRPLRPMTVPGPIYALPVFLPLHCRKLTIDIGFVGSCFALRRLLKNAVDSIGPASFPQQRCCQSVSAREWLPGICVPNSHCLWK